MQKLADKINEMWNLNAVAGPFSILSIGEVHYMPKRDDLYNARFIVWGLERLEELWTPSGASLLSFGVDLIGRDTGESNSPQFGIQIAAYPNNGDEWAVHKTYTPGSTRAQAVYNALCKALEVEP